MEFIVNNIAIAGAAVAVAAASVYYYATKPSSKPQRDEVKKINSVFHDKEEKIIHPKLIEKQVLTQGACPVKLFRFQLENPKQSLGLPIGQHIWLTHIIDGEEIKRSYTPTTTNDDLGYFDLVVKIYPKGKMTQYLDQLQIGDTITVGGPKGRFLYEKNKYAKIGMIAGGTGITPMLQVIKEILKFEDDNTEVTLLFGNITELDIILKDMIDDLTKQNPRFKVYYVLNEPPTEWTQGVGFITKQMIQHHLPAMGDDMNILMCGPLPMTNGMTKILKEELRCIMLVYVLIPR
jgi:cytochrome-b5 reductase